MRVLGFDPGTATVGYGIVEGKGNRLIHIAHGVITTPPDHHFAVRLKTIYEGCLRLTAEFKPDAVSIEKLYFAKNVTTGLAVAQARGVIALAAIQSVDTIGEYSATEVKNAVTGYGKAPKKQVQEMVKMLLNLDEIPRPDDAADALAVAICQLSARNFPNLEER